jgi:hypothetical protein
MRPTGLLVLGLSLAVTGCDDNPLNTRPPSDPPPQTQGVEAFLQVDRDQARPGERVRVTVRVQLGTESQAKVGSYTGRLKFDPQALAWAGDEEINDGLRVINPKGANLGEVRFAGAAARGLANLVLYQGLFDVKKAGYTDQLKLEMEELSAALTLGDLQPQLRIAPRVFLSQTAN